MNNPQEINFTLVENTINEFKENYGVDDEALKMLFKDYPDNGDIKQVTIKAAVLDKLYSTRIRFVDFPFVVQNIVENNAEITKLLKSHNREYELYYLIAEPNKEFINKKGEKEKVHNAYSFATKYLSFIKPDLYPIMDSYSKELLNKFCDMYPDKLRSLSASTNEYKQFCNTFDDFKDLINRIVKENTNHEYTAKEIDMFIWQYAKNLIEESKGS